MRALSSIGTRRPARTSSARPGSRSSVMFTVAALSEVSGGKRSGGLRRRGVGKPPGGLVMFICMFDQGDILDGLNEQQRRAATHEAGPLLVLAGAGTGKTRTLVARAAWLRDTQGMQANRILLLTFTRRAAGDMLARAASGASTAGGAGGRICGGAGPAPPRPTPPPHPRSC